MRLDSGQLEIERHGDGDGDGERERVGKDKRKKSVKQVSWRQKRQIETGRPCRRRWSGLRASLAEQLVADLLFVGT